MKNKIQSINYTDIKIINENNINKIKNKSTSRKTRKENIYKKEKPIRGENSLKDKKVKFLDKVDTKNKYSYSTSLKKGKKIKNI